MPVIGLVDKAHFKIQTKMKLLGILFLLCVLTMPVVAQDHCRIMSVSYTHLDVYKRQFQVCPVPFMIKITDSLVFEIFDYI